MVGKGAKGLLLFFFKAGTDQKQPHNLDYFSKAAAIQC